MSDELRIMIDPAGLVITPDSYRTNERHREIADRVLAASGYSSDEVVEIRISEVGTEIDWLNCETTPDHRRRLVDATVRTTRIEPR